MAWNISMASSGCLPGRAPSQPLHPCSSAERGGLETVLDCLGATEAISIVNILVLYPNHSSCWEENSLCPS